MLAKPIDARLRSPEGDGNASARCCTKTCHCLSGWWIGHLGHASVPSWKPFGKDVFSLRDGQDLACALDGLSGHGGRGGLCRRGSPVPLVESARQVPAAYSPQTHVLTKLRATWPESPLQSVTNAPLVNSPNPARGPSVREETEMRYKGNGGAGMTDIPSPSILFLERVVRCLPDRLRHGFAGLCVRAGIGQPLTIADIKGKHGISQ